MEDYHQKLEDLVSSVKRIKECIDKNNDEEYIVYMELALESKFEEIRELIKNKKHLQ